MREWPYTASSRDILGCTSPPTSRFPSALEMSPGLRPRDISRASGNFSVVGDVQTNTSLLSAVYGYNMSYTKFFRCTFYGGLTFVTRVFCLFFGSLWIIVHHYITSNTPGVHSMGSDVPHPCPMPLPRWHLLPQCYVRPRL